ncbi:hypothetical protein cyc_08609 [Cyclospora cayetanensis]|uniref:Uncharacterized protein n=1 Tax=Cyclospora cayetanensis TaxID=88456 RepID=A0A1D3CZK8_9EIME|nr:hypothetical protein cyc_08609 [Cyclospora cayetanensis]
MSYLRWKGVLPVTVAAAPAAAATEAAAPVSAATSPLQTSDHQRLYTVEFSVSLAAFSADLCATLAHLSAAKWCKEAQCAPQYMWGRVLPLPHLLLVLRFASIESIRLTEGASWLSLPDSFAFSAYVAGTANAFENAVCDFLHKIQHSSRCILIHPYPWELPTQEACWDITHAIAVQHASSVVAA